MSIFTKVLQKPVKTSRFDLTHDVKLSFNMGQLIPTCVMDVLPGDRITIDVEAMLRFTALIAPIMHTVKVITNFFFVPNRILWDGWEDFITGTNTEDPPPTFHRINMISVGDLGDYLGLPTDAEIPSQNVVVSAFPVAAYLSIYNYWYRDENLQPEIDATLVSGDNFNMEDYSQLPPLKRAKNHDYFTSALPFAQKGDAVTLPLLQDEAVPVKYKFNNQSGQIVRIGGGGNVDDPFEDMSFTPTGNTGGGNAGHLRGTDGVFTGDVNIDLGNTHEVNINEEASTVETLRAAFRLQEWLEKNARGGTRYSEHLKAHFNVSAQDARLQNPEYIGGHVRNMIISEVLNTAGGDGKAVGDMSGHGIAISKGKKFHYNAQEHGWIIGIMSVTPNTAYSQGVHRMWSRNTFLDYAWPSFANLGEQEILNKEIYIGGQTQEVGEQTFGYIPRYAEYKYMNNRIAGEFRTSLDFWHAGLNFGIQPFLNSDFIETHARDYDKIFAVDSQIAHTIYAHVFNNISAVRKLPKYGIPTI